MPLRMFRYPSLEELGDYTEQFLTMCGFYLTAQILFGDTRWFRLLEQQCMHEATEIDLVIEVQQFIELFWMAMHGFNFELSRELTRHSWAWIR